MQLKRKNIKRKIKSLQDKKTSLKNEIKKIDEEIRYLNKTDTFG